MMLKRAAQLLLGRYALYRIYRYAPAAGPPAAGPCGPLAPSPPGEPSAATDLVRASLAPLDIPTLMACGDDTLRELVSYTGEGCHAFGAWVEGQLAAAAFFWFGERYRTRNFWPLADNEAKLVQVTTSPSYRSRGLAAELIAYASGQMLDRGFHRLYARIWHSHAASRRAFEKAGWHQTALVFQCHPFGISRPMKWVRRSA